MTTPTAALIATPEREAERGVIELHRADCGAHSDSYRHTESHGRDPI
jgi:hypothetical protein